MGTVLAAPDCRTYPCREECCSYGADVWPHERERMIAAEVATHDEFTGPWAAEDGSGDMLYRTAVGARGCTFLSPVRGCRLHVIGHKPEVCSLAPRDPTEAAEMRGDEILPCHHEWRYGD